MKAWQFNDSADALEIIPVEVDAPQPGSGELLIRVLAAGVTPTELKWYPTTHQKSGKRRLNAIPVHEFSGIVASACAGADAKVGEEVFGMNDWFSDGALSEFCCTLPSMVIPKPLELSSVEAASIPIGALTAWQGLFDRADLQAGERVLIHGGSGAVGVFAIQLARSCRADVMTTASARHSDFLLQLGAQHVIDYRTERFEDFAKEMDVVFDTVGGATLQRSWSVLGPKGRLVTIAADSGQVDDARTKRAFFIVEPNQRQLREISRQLQSGQLQPVVNAVIPFSQADKAYDRQHITGSGRGKTVVTLTPPDSAIESLLQNLR